MSNYKKIQILPINWTVQRKNEHILGKTNKMADAASWLSSLGPIPLEGPPSTPGVRNWKLHFSCPHSWSGACALDPAKPRCHPPRWGWGVGSWLLQRVQLLWPRRSFPGAAVAEEPVWAAEAVGPVRTASQGAWELLLSLVCVPPPPGNSGSSLHPVVSSFPP